MKSKAAGVSQEGCVCPQLAACKVHGEIVKAIGTLSKRTAVIEKEARIAARKADNATLKVDSLERKFLVMQKDMMAVVADLQGASARSTEQLAKYNVTLMEILFAIKEMARNNNEKAAAKG